LILDEAQAIKNPGTKQAEQIKKLSVKMRIAMTGTPIEKLSQIKEKLQVAEGIERKGLVLSSNIKFK
jgi:hypothetical protein